MQEGEKSLMWSRRLSELRWEHGEMAVPRHAMLGYARLGCAMHARCGSHWRNARIISVASVWQNPSEVLEGPTDPGGFAC